MTHTDQLLMRSLSAQLIRVFEFGTFKTRKRRYGKADRLEQTLAESNALRPTPSALKVAFALR